MRILVITSCTGDKGNKSPGQLTVDDFRLGAEHVRAREAELEEYMLPAGEMYTGQQHVRLMRGVTACREGKTAKVDPWVLSAGYGMIPEDRMIAPYECTFRGMKVGEIRSLADVLHVPVDFRNVVSQEYDLGLILLGDSYLRACDLTQDVAFGGPTLFFCGTGMQKKLSVIDRVKIVTLSNAEATRFPCGLIGLKGELAHRIFVGLVGGKLTPKKLTRAKADVLALLDDGKATPAKPEKKPTMRPNPNVDKVIQIPNLWWDKPHRKKLCYFIPEWDDLVDPDYDFLTDTHSGGRSNWANEVYAHQMYPQPNYDGLLMSRAVAEKSKAKKERINEMGVHRMLRVPREFPIMGDCGAFDYMMDDVPPYSTEDVLDYYTRLDFDFGVSVDHLIVTATEHQKKERYELTINNAEEFLKQHRKAKLPWEPIGAVQGWDPDSYGKAAKQYVKMGYKYIGLGGLVRSSTKSIMELLQAVNAKVPKDLKIHLFGFARLNAMKPLSELGVASVDSASALRQAWFGAKDNYWSESGAHYRAIRIPKAGRSFRAKNIVKDGRATLEFVEKAERESIEALRRFDLGKTSVDEVIRILEELDHLITPDRPTFMEQYRRTLEDAPWKKCSCAICQKDGVEVIIFRGNDRNRRRGFHNTYVFYRILQEILGGEREIKGEVVSADADQLKLSLPM